MPLDGEHLTGGNPLYWLGDGMTVNEKSMTGDRAWYLDEVDIPPGMCIRIAHRSILIFGSSGSLVLWPICFR